MQILRADSSRLVLIVPLAARAFLQKNNSRVRRENIAMGITHANVARTSSAFRFAGEVTQDHQCVELTFHGKLPGQPRNRYAAFGHPKIWSGRHARFPKFPERKPDENSWAKILIR